MIVAEQKQILDNQWKQYQDLTRTTWNQLTPIRNRIKDSIWELKKGDATAEKQLRKDLDFWGNLANGLLYALSSLLNGLFLISRKKYIEKQLNELQVLYDDNGIRKSIYSWRLSHSDPVPKGKRYCEALRDMEREIQQDLNDGITPLHSQKATLNERFDLHIIDLHILMILVTAYFLHKSVHNYGLLKRVWQKGEVAFCFNRRVAKIVWKRGLDYAIIIHISQGIICVQYTYEKTRKYFPCVARYMSLVKSGIVMDNGKAENNFCWNFKIQVI